jgi:hypothetical protein
MAGLQTTWMQQRRQVFDAAMQSLAASLATLALQREPIEASPGVRGLLRQAGAALGLGGEAQGALDAAEQRLAQQMQTELQRGTQALLQLHGLSGQASGVVLQRVAAQFQARVRVPEDRAAWVGGLVSGALGGLAADLAAGGLTLGGGMLAGGLLGALGAAGVARGLNVVRGTDSSWVALGDDALPPLVQAAVLRYLAVAHFGRGRGDWTEGEAPPHWGEVVQAVLAPEQPLLQAAFAGRDAGHSDGLAPEALAERLAPLLARSSALALERLYPGAPALAPNNPAP